MNEDQMQSPEKVSFKKVSPEDWEKFREIRLKGLQSDPQAFGGTFEGESQEGEEYWKERFSNPERCFYAAEEGGIFIATAGSKKITDDNWMIVAVYTLPEFRGKNISQGLINRVIDEARNTGATKVSLMVNPIQESAVNLYERMGFKTVKIEKDQKMGDGKSYDEYYMEKSLDPQTSN
jgi:ribosomal protein S18 acetylase RimI-like enzyme